MEDLLVARIFRQLNVYPYDTKDETGREHICITHPAACIYISNRKNRPTNTGTTNSP
jgi:hypothetical protein